MDIKSAPFHSPFGDRELTVTVCSYAVNKRLAINLRGEMNRVQRMSQVAL